MNTDPIADMLSRIRNAIAVNQADVALPHSKIKEAVANVLQKNGFLAEVNVTKDEKERPILNIMVSVEGKPPVITKIDRVSSPGRREYVGAKEIKRVKGGRGITVISTSKGIMSGDEARKQSLGGELICEVF